MIAPVKLITPCPLSGWGIEPPPSSPSFDANADDVVDSISINIAEEIVFFFILKKTFLAIKPIALRIVISQAEK